MYKIINNEVIDTIFIIFFIIAVLFHFIIQIKILKDDAKKINKDNNKEKIKNHNQINKDNNKEKFEKNKQINKRINYYILISFLLPTIMFLIMFLNKKLTLILTFLIIIFSIKSITMTIKHFKEKNFYENEKSEKIKEYIINSQIFFWFFFSSNSSFIILNELKNVIEILKLSNAEQYFEIMKLSYLTIKIILLVFYTYSNINIILSNTCILLSDKINEKNNDEETFFYDINNDLIKFNDNKEHKILKELNKCNFYIKIPIFVIISTFNDIINSIIKKIRNLIINKSKKNETYIMYKSLLKITIIITLLIYIYVKIGNYYETTKDLYKTIFYSGMFVYALNKFKKIKNKED